MSGNLYGPDQIRRINNLYPTLVNHLRELLVKDHTGVGLMRVHVQVETFDSDEMARIFRELSFISPREKLALVRAAIYELMAKEPSLFIAPSLGLGSAAAVTQPIVFNQEPTTFTPPRFQLNINKASDIHGMKAEDTPAPAPVVTSTHQSKVAQMVDDGNKRMTEQQTKLDAAVAKLRESSVSKPIEIMAVPDDANLQDAAEETPIEE